MVIDAVRREMGEWSRGSILWPTIALAIVVAINSKSVVAEVDEGGREGEFVAGSFILTQKALNEAPYRYSRFLTEALERMELADPPTKKDEENCNVKYKIEPSGEEVPSLIGLFANLSFDRNKMFKIVQELPDMRGNTSLVCRGSQACCILGRDQYNFILARPFCSEQYQFIREGIFVCSV